MMGFQRMSRDFKLVLREKARSCQVVAMDIENAQKKRNMEGEDVKDGETAKRKYSDMIKRDMVVRHRALQRVAKTC